MYIFKMLKNDEVVYVGRAKCLKPRFKVIKKTESPEAFRNADKIVYGEIANEEEAIKYKDLLLNYYTPKYNSENNRKKLCTKNFKDNLKYIEYIEDEYEEMQRSKLERIKKEERLKKIKAERIKNREFVKEKIRQIHEDKRIRFDRKVIPLYYKCYPRIQFKEKTLNSIYIITPEGYPLRGIIAIKKLYFQIYVENIKTEITNEAINEIVQKYGDFYLYDTETNVCSYCNEGTFFKSPCFFIKSINTSYFHQKLGFDLYEESKHFVKLEIEKNSYKTKYCHDCAPILKKQLMEEDEHNEKRELYMEYGIGLTHNSKEFWETSILELDSELKEALRHNLENIYLKRKSDKESAEISIEIIYNLGFAQQIPEWVKKKRPVKGIFYVGNYYFERTLVEAFNGLKNVKANEWY